MVDRSDMDKIIKGKDVKFFNVSNEQKAIHEVVNAKKKGSNKMITGPVHSNSNKKLDISSKKSDKSDKLVCEISPLNPLKKSNKLIPEISPRNPLLSNKVGLKKTDKLETGKNIKPLNVLKPLASPKELSKTMQSEKATPVINPLEYQNGKVWIKFENKKRKKFYDLLYDGLNTAFDIAIDYTSSNGDPKNENSLHTLNLINNKYAKAIKSCGAILKEYDDDQCFPLYGFGGVPQNGKEVSHCFNVNGKKNAVINGMDEVINTYLTSLKQVELVGPTYFHEVLKTIVENIKKEMKNLTKKEMLTYHVCLILTDGKIEDMNETIDVLIEAAKLPISVIIVGIGNDDFAKMETLGKYPYLIYILYRWK